MGNAGVPSRQSVARRWEQQLFGFRKQRGANRLQNDVRSSAGDTAGPSQEALQGGVGQEALEGEFDFHGRLLPACVCAAACVCSKKDILYAV